jgi:hypothetical protein
VAGCGQALAEPQAFQGVAFERILQQEGPMPMETYDPHKTTTEVRGANRRLDNFWVLIISTVVVIALLAIVYIVFSMNTPPSVIQP